MQNLRRARHGHDIKTVYLCYGTLLLNNSGVITIHGSRHTVDFGLQGLTRFRTTVLEKSQAREQ